MPTPPKSAERGKRECVCCDNRAARGSKFCADHIKARAEALAPLTPLVEYPCPKCGTVSVNCPTHPLQTERERG